MRVVYDLRRAPGKRVTNVKLLCTRCAVPQYEELMTNETYLIIMNAFLLNGGDNFNVFKTSCSDVKKFGKKMKFEFDISVLIAIKTA